MIAKLRLLGIALLIIAPFWLIMDVRSCVVRHREAKAIQNAGAQHETAAVEAGKAEAHDQEAEEAEPGLQANDKLVARLQAELNLLQSAPKPPPSLPLVPGISAVDPAPVDLHQVDAKKDELIGALYKANGDLKTQLETVTEARDSWRASAQASQKEAISLRAALSTRTDRAWAVGVAYGTDRQAGAWVEHDLGPVRVGIDVVRHPLPGGSSTLEAVGRIGWSF